jgi:predicted transcriptional regulator
MRKPGPQHDIPPPLELECLKALWNLGDGSVKDVRGVLTESRHLAYTTVMTVLDRLVKRGTVERRKIGRSFTYKPKVERQTLRALAVKELVDTFFDGSPEELLRHLAAGDGMKPAGSELQEEPEVTNSLDTELL